MNTVVVTARPETLQESAAQYVESGRLGAAAPLLAASLALAPPSPELTLLVARFAAESGDPQRALRDLDAAITAAPNHVGLRKCRADVRQRVGDADGAVRDAAEAVVAAPDDPDARAILGAALLDLGRCADAVTCLRDAVAARPEDPAFREILAIALERSGDTDAALQVLSEGMEQAPANTALRNASILLCVRQRDFLRAAHFADQARTLGIADACTFGMQGHALSSLGHHEEAATSYQEALKLAPEDPYVRHLVHASGAIKGEGRAPESYIRTVFDGYADRFEPHLIALRYGIPGAIRSVLLSHPRIAAGQPLGPTLDLGCGTGLAALALSDLPIGPVIGVDLSSRMLAHAQAKGLYADLQEADIVQMLTADTRKWGLIIAADVLCYFGALEDVLAGAHARLRPDGLFIFSVEQLVPDRDGVVPGNGNWALQRQGRFAQSEAYVFDAAIAAGFRVARLDRPAIRQEAGADVPGLLFTLQPVPHDD